jgi:hypothetical protein
MKGKSAIVMSMITSMLFVMVGVFTVARVISYTTFIFGCIAVVFIAIVGKLVIILDEHLTAKEN